MDEFLAILLDILQCDINQFFKVDPGVFLELDQKCESLNLFLDMVTNKSHETKTDDYDNLDQRYMYLVGIKLQTKIWL